MNPMVIGGIAGGLGVLIVGLAMPAKKCPDCGTQLPKVRLPGTGAQALKGGWTCPKCGCHIDRKGQKIS